MRALLALILAVAAAAAAIPAAAQTLVVSQKAEDVSLTVYRAPNRGSRPINKNWPQGYALITETRTVNIPAGESVIRFEGVSEGMFPESAIVTGLPQGVREKNRDARLLSPAGLVDANLKREVSLVRTNKATGKVTRQKAMITAGPNGGVILQTDAGYEALRCTGLPERMVYGGVPAGLSAKPTLSIITRSDRPVTAKLTLTYMSAGFDWQANYLVQVSGEQVPADGNDVKIPKDKAALFAWLTLANGGNQSFLNANLMAIAGEPNRERRAAQPRPTGKGLRLNCWPMQRTHQVPYRGLPGYGGIPAPPPQPMMEMAADSIVVTGSGAQRNRMAKLSPVASMTAEQEDLGDLKLYRIPEPVSVNAKGQKQVAMITQPAVFFNRLYTANVTRYRESSGQMAILLRGKNSEKEGLGLPMPSGQVQVFEGSNYGPLLVGETTLKDRAVGEKVEMTVGYSSDVRLSVTKISESKKSQSWRVEITNARGEPIKAEVKIPLELRGRARGIRKVDGVPTWIGMVPANGEVTFRYTVRLSR
ncbi:MAG: hypothetical protein V3V15_05440 [Sphingorhabdus sp.]